MVSKPRIQGLMTDSSTHLNPAKWSVRFLVQYRTNLGQFVKQVPIHHRDCEWATRSGISPCMSSSDYC